MKPMIMGLFIGYGHGPRGWDDPGLRPDYDWRRPEIYQDLPGRGRVHVDGRYRLLDAHTAGEKISKAELMEGASLYERLVTKLLS